MQLNDNFESFSNVLLRVRDLPILSILKSIKTYIRDLFVSRKEEVKKWKYDINDRIWEEYTRNKNFHQLVESSIMEVQI